MSQQPMSQAKAYVRRRLTEMKLGATCTLDDFQPRYRDRARKLLKEMEGEGLVEATAVGSKGRLVYTITGFIPANERVLMPRFGPLLEAFGYEVRRLAGTPQIVRLQ